jgi:hypothetical protein
MLRHLLRGHVKGGEAPVAAQKAVEASSVGVGAALPVEVCKKLPAPLAALWLGFKSYPKVKFYIFIQFIQTCYFESFYIQSF